VERIIFLVEDSATTRKLTQHVLTRAGYRVQSFERAEPCLRALAETEPSTICMDIELPGMSGLDALDEIRNIRPQVPVIMLTAERDASVGVQAMKKGAVDYLVKPVQPEELAQAVAASVERHDLVLEVRRLKAQVAETVGGNEIIGQTPIMNDLRSRMGLILRNDVSVFLQGESGTGKELIAHTIHSNSTRSGKPFVAVNCGAIPKDLQESYFFGHEKGAFTGAVSQHKGFFEEADSGTLFLDELSELTPDAQVKLLRALQEKEIRRVGGTRDISVDVRVVSASNRDLKAMAGSGEFREDLFYRLVVYPLTAPSLRDRRADIPLLAGHFLRFYSEQLGLALPEISQEALQCLMSHAWPGNVRELQNAVQFALLACQGQPILPEHLPDAMPRNAEPARIPDGGDGISLADAATGEIRPFEDIERDVLEGAIEMADGNVTLAARRLRIGRATLYRRLQAWKDDEELPRAS